MEEQDGLLTNMEVFDILKKKEENEKKVEYLCNIQNKDYIEKKVSSIYSYRFFASDDIQLHIFFRT